tara:strand:+ start:13300 stop:13839 length:540 start_codon:yes stop_codon:yes gene_type:complete
MITIFKVLAYIFYFTYGYEGINVLIRLAPSKVIIEVLKQFGAKVGKNVRIQAPFIIHNADQLKPIYQNLVIGDDCYIGRDCIMDLMGKIEIGSKSTLSHRVVLNTHTDVGSSPLKNEELKNSHGNISIEEGAYIGTGVTILEDVVIGRNTIIGASSLINKSIPANKKAYGIPCKVQKNK